MKTLAPGITVNGISITPEEIGAEVQYHPADSLQSAKYHAMQALVIRELLVQRAAELGLSERAEVVNKPDAIIDSLLERELDVPEPDGPSCKRYYKSNEKKFKTSPLWEVSHILYLAPPEDAEERAKAKARAVETVRRLKEDPDAFEAIAREDSACSSAAQGGRIGQVSQGQTMPQFEAALRGMSKGDISHEPVETSVGYHVIKIHEYVEGRPLPFDAVEDWVRDHLATQSWQRAFSQYVQILAGKSEIKGFIFKGADSPLVQ